MDFPVLEHTTDDEAKQVVAALLRDAERQMVVAAFNVSANIGVDAAAVDANTKKLADLKASVARIKGDASFAPYVPVTLADQAKAAAQAAADAAGLKLVADEQ